MLAADNVPIDNPAAIDSNPVSTAATVCTMYILLPLVLYVKHNSWCMHIGLGSLLLKLWCMLALMAF